MPLSTYDTAALQVVRLPEGIAQERWTLSGTRQWLGTDWAVVGEVSEEIDTASHVLGSCSMSIRFDQK